MADRCGKCKILALKPIRAGEEITISYINETAPLYVRRIELADYGIACNCPKCMEDRERGVEEYYDEDGDDDDDEEDD